MNYPVREFMTSKVATLNIAAPLRELAVLVMVRRLRHVPVVEKQGRLVGIATDRDLKKIMPSQLPNDGGLDTGNLRAILDDNTVESAMTRSPFHVSPDTPVADVVKLMIEKKIGGVPVVDDQMTVVGIFTGNDALKALLKIIEIAQSGEDQ